MEGKRLVKGEKQIAGVCSGLANYFDIDPSLVRLAFMYATVVGGIGLILYIIADLIIPEE